MTDLLETIDRSRAEFYRKALLSAALAVMAKFSPVSRPVQLKVEFVQGTDLLQVGTNEDTPSLDGLQLQLESLLIAIEVNQQFFGMDSSSTGLFERARLLADRIVSFDDESRDSFEREIRAAARNVYNYSPTAESILIQTHKWAKDFIQQWHDLIEATATKLPGGDPL